MTHNKSAFKATKGEPGVLTWVSGTTYNTNIIVEKDLILYKSNTQTSTLFIPSEWNVIGVKSSGAVNEIQLSDGFSGFTSDTRLTWIVTASTLNAGTGNTSASIGDHNFTFGHNNTIVSGDTTMNFIVGSYSTIGRSVRGSFIGENLTAYGSGQKQNTILIGFGNCTYSTGTQSGAVAIGQYNRIVGDTTSSIAIGFKNRSEADFSIAMGFNSCALGRTSFAHGDDLSSNNKTPISNKVLASGRHAVNISANDTGQSIGCGALADWSGIFGGYNHNIAIGNTSAVIIGGNTIDLTGTSYVNHTAVSNLAIWDTPIVGSIIDEILVWDSATNKVKKIPQYSAANGLTYNTVNGVLTLGGTLTGNTIVNTVNTYGIVFGYNSEANTDNSFAQGFYSCASGNHSSALGAYARAYGTASMAIGNDTKSIGTGSLSTGQGTCAIGIGSFAGGIGLVDTKRIRASGNASFNFSENTSTQVAGHGALANQSTIIGGRNHNIESGNIRSAIIGGDSIKLTGTSYIDYAAVPSLAIWNTPTQGISSNEILVWDSTTKKIKKVEQTTVGFVDAIRTSATTYSLVSDVVDWRIERNYTNTGDTFNRLAFLQIEGDPNSEPRVFMGIEANSGTTANAFIDINNDSGIRKVIITSTEIAGVSHTFEASETSMKMEQNNGGNIRSITLGSTMLVTDSAINTGLQYAADYSTSGVSLGDRWIPDIGYTNSVLGGQILNVLVITPTATEDGFHIAWNDTNQEYELVSAVSGGSSPSVGADNQIQIGDGAGGFKVDSAFYFDGTGTDAIGIGTTTTTATGTSSIAIGDGAKADNLASIAIGRNSNVTGDYSTLIGYSTTIQTLSTASTFSFRPNGVGIFELGVGDSYLNSPNVQLFASGGTNLYGSTQAGIGMLRLDDATTPPQGTLGSGGLLFVSGGTIYLHNTAGTTTDLTAGDPPIPAALSDATGITMNFESKHFGLKTLTTTNTSITLTLTNVIAGANQILSVVKNTTSTVTITLAGSGLTFYGYNNSDYNTTPDVILAGASGDIFDISFLARSATEIGVAVGITGN